MIIGLCGKTGSGKSTLAKDIKSLCKKEVAIVDIDKIGHDVLEISEVKDNLVKCFGKEVLENGKVNRKVLSRIVFESKEEMEKLTDITWNSMEEIIDKILEENKDKVVILDWILLPKTKFFLECDIKVLLDIDILVRKERVIKRDNITNDAFILREKASLEYNKEDLDYVIVDNYKEVLERLVNSL